MRAFVAVEVGENARQKIAELQAQLPSGIKRVEPENLHMTLAFLGEIDDGMAEKVKAALADVHASSFAVICSGVGVFPSASFVRVVWVGAESTEMKELHQAVWNALAPLGFKPEKFSPHITIGRPKEKVEVKPFLQKHAVDALGSFEATELKLKKSTLTPKGPVYEDVCVKKLG